MQQLPFRSSSSASPSPPNRRAGRTGRKRRGAACVEMAFIAPVIFLLLFASVEFARMMMIKQALTNAAREGCRQAVLITTRDYRDAETTVRDYLRGCVAQFDDESVVRVSISPQFVSVPATGTEVTVSVEVNCSDVSWLPPMFLAEASISGTAKMNRE